MKFLSAGLALVHNGNLTNTSELQEKMRRQNRHLDTQASGRSCHICAGTGLTLATSAPGPGSLLPHLRRD